MNKRVQIKIFDYESPTNEKRANDFLRTLDCDDVLSVTHNPVMDINETVINYITIVYKEESQ